MKGLYLNSLGIATPLGIGKRQVNENLISGSTAGLLQRGGFVKDKQVFLGEVAHPLPEMPAHLQDFDTRNCRMLILALDEIRDEVDRTITRFGRDRVAVVLGTSTSGMEEGEIAFSERLRHFHMLSKRQAAQLSSWRATWDWTALPTL